MHHVINCQFTLTRQNVQSKEYDITYSGEGTYSLEAEVVDKISSIDFDHWPNGIQEITLDDITTKNVNADGKVTLKYTTKLSEK